MKNLTLPQPGRTRALKSSELHPRLRAGLRLPTPREERGHGPSGEARPGESAGRTTRRAHRTPSPSVFFPGSPAPRPIAARFALAPHGGVSRGRGGQWYSPCSPAPGSGSFQPQKSIVGAAGGLSACALGRRPAALRLPGWRGLGVRGFLASDAPGRWAALRVVRASCSPESVDCGGRRPGPAALPLDRRRPRRRSQAAYPRRATGDGFECV
ncbi:translation initiation factor IF-2-like [Ailuropoda melanoleuca]|uniref:translation initiation factor IF-2-like n=1 Tax=Ailuropoda melanoleuca TaxID=9646 RepID=UPI00149449F2|nr:translation initiation factor IF-2-like [Ailuropoda melanoleuca]